MYALPAPALMSLMRMQGGLQPTKIKKKSPRFLAKARVGAVQDTETGMLVYLKGIPERPAVIIPATRNGSGHPGDMNIN